MNTFSLTYAITTYNRLPFLREGLIRLLSARRPDEEIVIVDGGSTDGTVEYLAELNANGTIDSFVSESDQGQGHGINKALLRSHGDLIKPINDDDLYDFESIGHAKTYMQSAPQVDALFSNAQIVVWKPQPHLICHGYSHYDVFPKRTHPFPFGDIGLMLRRDSLPLLGLFNPQIAWIDYEYSMRITSTKANVAYMDHTTGIRLTNDSSKSARLWRQLEEERGKIDAYYSRPWKPASVLDRLRSLKAQLRSGGSRLFAGSAGPASSDESTSCPAAADAFAIGEALLSQVRAKETTPTFRTSGPA